MKLDMKVQSPNDPEIDLEFEVPIPDRLFKILKESGRLVFAITQAIENMRAEFKNEDNSGSHPV
jgi:hypothetical protein